MASDPVFIFRDFDGYRCNVFTTIPVVEPTDTATYLVLPHHEIISREYA